MQQLVIKLEKYLDSLSKRDQAALYIIILVAILVIWLNLIYLPLSDGMTVLKQDINQKETELVVLHAKMQAIEKNINADPDIENRDQLNRYLQVKNELDEALVGTSIQIINPQEMAVMLEQLLKTQTGLKFVSLENKPATPEFVKTQNNSEAITENVNTIYRHSMILQMEGGYHDALLYLKKLEQLPWRFFWQSVEIESSRYPNTVIILEVYTLGLREGLIGA